MRFSATPGGPRSAGPTFGQHNEQVLREILGYDDERVVELITSGALE
jgi:crotonobetainyl-CoA:carnitine CoA-transferase CaiB-like acyl-CoA transferase